MSVGFEFWEQKASAQVTDNEAIGGGGDKFVKLGLLEQQKDSLILDAACGYGRYSLPLAQEDKTVVAFDASKSMTKRYKQNLAGKNLDVHLVCASITNMPFKNGAFPFAFCFASFYLLPKKCWKSGIEEFKRVSSCSIIEFRNILNFENLKRIVIFNVGKILHKTFPDYHLSFHWKITFERTYLVKFSGKSHSVIVNTSISRGR
ncbi:MAG: class I SAM-dependent methyltransferase [Candidatus Babeliales bacterium]|jgi:SAM-dependent methyltransferase